MLANLNSLLTLLVPGAIALAVQKHLFFMLAVWRKDNSLADISWGLGFITVVATIFSVTPTNSPRSVLVLLLVTLWGLRLAGHIMYRNSLKKKEDWRYAQWREEWGQWWLLRTYLQVFILQGVLLLVIASAAAYSVGTEPQPMLGIIDLVGVLVWGIGFFFEAVGDYQLLRFKQDPTNKGKIMTEGVWQFTRHPNYFGELSMWWGIWLMAVAAGGWWLLLSPLTITYLLLYVSGIPMLEKKYADNPAYQAYKKRTSALIPLPPRS